MSVSNIEAAYSAHLEKLSEFQAKLKFDFGDDRLLIDGTVSPATISHDDAPADCIVRISPENLEKIIRGELDPRKAFRTGKLRVRGSAAIALKFHGLALDARGE